MEHPFQLSISRFCLTFFFWRNFNFCRQRMWFQQGPNLKEMGQIAWAHKESANEMRLFQPRLQKACCALLWALPPSCSTAAEFQFFSIKVQFLFGRKFSIYNWVIAFDYCSVGFIYPCGKIYNITRIILEELRILFQSLSELTKFIIFITILL